jgi:hypothetical protein
LYGVFVFAGLENLNIKTGGSMDLSMDLVVNGMLLISVLLIVAVLVVCVRLEAEQARILREQRKRDAAVESERSKQAAINKTMADFLTSFLKKK